MSLRSRLAALYTTIVGGIILIFGVAVYGAVSFSLISQVDRILYQTVEKILPVIYVDVGGNLQLRQPQVMEISPGILVQIWNREGELVLTNLEQLNRSLDPNGLDSGRPVFGESNIETMTGDAHLRVLTVPMVIGVGDRLVGYLQLATSLAVVDATQEVLVTVLLIGTALAMVVAGFGGWFSTRQALAPLGDVTEVALQITRADDLSRRIPYRGQLEDEVGQLITAFNQTLGRLESLFNTQRRFLADVGHELRTPLTVIRGNVDLMRRMDCLDVESMESIQNEVDRLTRMVGDLLLLAQAESGKLPLAMRLVELDTLLFEVMQQMRVLAKDRLNLRIGEIDQVLVCGDQDRLKQVMLNLISNAINYTQAGGEVVVGVGKEAKRARLTVTDNGAGIPEEDLPYIFERFYRGEKSRTRQKEGKGFGLGLSIAYWIVRNHGGTIDVDSRVGHGTTFCVWLPLAEGDCKQESFEAIT